MSDFPLVYVLLGLVVAAGIFLVIFGLVRKPSGKTPLPCSPLEIEPSAETGSKADSDDSTDGTVFSHKSPLVPDKYSPEVVQTQREKEIESASVRPGRFARLRRFFRGTGAKKTMGGLE